MHEHVSQAELIASWPEAKRQAFYQSLTLKEAEELEYHWPFWARPNQLLPGGDDWILWLILAGRGWGKSRTGAEVIREWVETRICARLALVGRTAADVRDVMVEGESGLLAISPPWFRPEWEPSKRRLTWPNGAIATTYTAEEPDVFRGPQHDGAWCDEVASWKYPERAWENLLFGLRLGKRPRIVGTTTPKPTPHMRELIADGTTRITKGKTEENERNLAHTFLKLVVGKFKGTRLGRQELDAEMLEDAPGALWKRAQLEKLRQVKPPNFVRIVIAVDPSVSSDAKSAETGIIAAGLGEDGHGYVLVDASLEQPTPHEWGQATIAAFRTLKADRVVGEVNNGGDLVESNVRSVDKNVPFTQVRASRGKAVRAEPVAGLYEQKRIHHVGFFPQLEDQMVQWEPGVSTWSPNRVDALVWAIWELMLEGSDDDGSLIIVKRRG